MKMLNEVIDDFTLARESFKNYISSGVLKKESLNELQSMFVEIKTDLTHWKAKLSKSWVRTDDKAATAIKYRIAVAISKGEFKDLNTEVFIPKCSLSQAEKLAAGCNTYKEFLDKRAFNKESLTNITDLREDCNSYINLIKDLLK
ncbi:MAG: hypothetical protein KBH21_00085 [Acetoanaerobium sp.]|nr:hypothetical protein [Acetoanaerobium sp.]